MLIQSPQCRHTQMWNKVRQILTSPLLHGPPAEKTAFPSSAQGSLPFTDPIKG